MYILANYSFYFPFLGHTLWLKHTLIMVIYVFWSKVSKKAQAQKENCYGRSTILIKVKYMHFYPFIHCTLHFLDTLFGENTLWIKESMYFWLMAPERPHLKVIFLLMGNYIVWSQIFAFSDPYSLHFTFFRHPVLSKNEFKQYICIVLTQGGLEPPIY